MSIDDATPADWDLSHKAMYKTPTPQQTELTFGEHSAARALDLQVGGTHYKDMKIQPIEFIQANGIGFCAGNVIKYVCRYNSKGGKADLEKARHYIDLLMESL